MREDYMEKLEKMFPRGYMIIYKANDEHVGMCADPKDNALIALFTMQFKRIWEKAKELREKDEEKRDYGRED